MSILVELSVTAAPTEGVSPLLSPRAEGADGVVWRAPG